MIWNFIGIGRVGMMNFEEVEMFNSFYVVDWIICCFNDWNIIDGIIIWCVNLVYCGICVYKYVFFVMKNENVFLFIGFFVVDFDVVVEIVVVVFMVFGGELVGYFNYFIFDFSFFYDV